MGTVTTSTGLGSMADATPDSRDRFVDLLRAFSILVVVLGHWLMAIVYLRNGELEGQNALDAVPGLWILTWVLQVMPLFFFVGGFSNVVGWRASVKRGEGYRNFLRSRVMRLLRPTFVFIGVGTGIATIVGLAFPGSLSSIARATELLAKPLWFLSVYVLVIALAPVMVALHERFGARVLVALGTAAIVVDIVRIGFDLTAVGYLNFAFVWLFAHQLGFFYADGALTAFSRRFFTLTAIGALGVLALLTGSGIYSPSMVGMVTEAASNNSPPSICLMVLTVWLVGAAMLVRPAASRWLQNRRVWVVVIAANSMIMTVFLWHLTALLVAVLAVFPIGFPQPIGGSAQWWAWRPVWLVILTMILAGFVALFGRFERAGLAARPPRSIAPSSSKLATGAGVAAIVTGLAGFAQFGFALAPQPATPTDLLAQPLFNALLVVLGYRALASRRPIGG
jgi:hypothetical protein